MITLRSDHDGDYSTMSLIYENNFWPSTVLLPAHSILYIFLQVSERPMNCNIDFDEKDPNLYGYDY